MRRNQKILGLFMIFALIFSSVPSVFAAAEPIEEVRSLIKTYYVEEVSDALLSKPTIQEMTELLDPYSVYMTKEEYVRYINSINQELVGIGIVLNEHEKGIEVVQTIVGGPAERAGIRAGDIMTHVGSENLAGKSSQTAVSLISGDEGTTVTLTFLQKTTGKSVTVSIVREKISLPVVESAMLGGGVGYIRLNSFSLDAAEEIGKAVQSLQGARGYILDVRNNGGGYVSAAQDVTGLFPGAEYAFQLRERGSIGFLFGSFEQPVQFTKPVHLLVNGNSASASEMVGAAVQEQGGATLYGQKTYGKGSMQTMFILSDESVLKLTTGRFYSPEGTVIDGVGVEPEVVTEEGRELVESHRDHLLSFFGGYKELASLSGVPEDKVFTLRMNTVMNWGDLAAGDIQLIQLGGEVVPVDVTVSSTLSVKIKPKERLESGAEYLMVIHPKWKSRAGLGMKDGYYLKVMVE